MHSVHTPSNNQPEELRIPVLLDVFTAAELGEDCREPATIFVSDGASYQVLEPNEGRGIRTLEWLHIIAENLGGAITLSTSHGLSNDILEENMSLDKSDRKSHKRLKLAVLLYGISTQEFWDGALYFDPLENRIQY